MRWENIQRHCLADLQVSKVIGYFGLSIEEDKSRLIEFGRYTKERCRKAGTKPEILEQKTA